MSTETDGETGLQLVGRLLDPASRADPYPIYAGFRALGPVWIEEMSSLVVTGYHDCETLLRDSRLSTGRWRYFGTEQEAEPYPPDAPSSVRQPWFLSQDPPDHTRLRRLVSGAFTAPAVARMEGAIAPLVDELVYRADEQGAFDVLSGLARSLPVTVICRILGVPRDDERLFQGWSVQLTRLLDGFPDPDETGGETPQWVGGMVEMHRYVNELVAERRRYPRGDDLISGLLAVEDDGDTRP
jgi:cytochrome P450